MAVSILERLRVATVVKVVSVLVYTTTERSHDASAPCRSAVATRVEALASAVCSVDVATSDVCCVKTDMTVEALVTSETSQHAARPQLVRHI